MVFRMFLGVLLAAAVTAAQLDDAVIDNTTKSNSQLEEEKQVMLIIGGTHAKETEFPHMAAIGYKSSNKIRYLCGGSLISLQWVVTAGHCVQNTEKPLVPTTVRLGDIRPEAGNHPHAQVFGILTTVPHPEYRYPLKYNDIALLKLDRVVQLNEYVGIACINKVPAISSAYGFATGWGKTESASKSEYLLKVQLPLTPQKKCESVYKEMINESEAFKAVLPEGIKSTMLCAGYADGGKDTCQGDSGGPLQVKQNKGHCTWVVIGITSFGNQCAQPNSYAVYTRVSSYAKWIDSVIKS